MRLAVAVAAALLAPATARADDVRAGIAFAAFAPPEVAALAGDTVIWTNLSVRTHTVNAVDGSWSSPELMAADTYSHTYDAPGSFPYYCRLHPFMTGRVDVGRLLIDPPSAPAASGRPYPLHGRTALAPQTPLTIEADPGTGYRAVGTAQAGADGGFAASVTPSDTASYRVVAGADASPPITLLVLNRTVHAHARRSRDEIAVAADVTPYSRGAKVVLQMRLRERFGWWPVRTARLDRFSHVRFSITHRRAVAVRVVVTLEDGATALAASPVLRIGSLHRAKRAG